MADRESFDRPESQPETQPRDEPKGMHRMASTRQVAGVTDVNPGIQLVGFDFDCTLAAVHVFAKVERAYLENEYLGSSCSRIEILSDLTRENDDLEYFFGGDRRLAKLKECIQFLAERAKAKLYVLSHGYTQVCGYALELIGVRRHFKGVFGRDSGLMLKMNGDKRRC